MMSRFLFNKQKGFSLIESLISLTIISIVLTVFIMSLSRHFNVGKDLSNCKLDLAMEKIKTEVQKGNTPIDLIIENIELSNHHIKYYTEKIDKSTYYLKISIIVNNNNKVIRNNVLIIKNYENFEDY